MTLHLVRDIDALQRKILDMSSRVEEMIHSAFQALSNGRPELAEAVFRTESQVDQCEVEIEEECLKILALHQPVAKQLRTVAIMMKANNDLERIADLAVNLAERAVAVSSAPLARPPEALESMVGIAWNMVSQALDAFFKLDPARAEEVLRRDDELDSLNRSVIQGLEKSMQAEPENVPLLLHFFSASRHIERIGDHATNIAEDVIYLVRGEITRHQRESFHVERKP